ncbi:MAG TPA: O-methyltransferase [Beutenbergiaceae bacterium]|nr:O-methyltransferase [Beutenbergiaceae bacterium]
MEPQRLWSEVDHYFTEHLRPADAALAEAVRAAGDLPQIQVSELLGGFLSVLTRAAGAQRVLEIGTLFGYSTIHLARAVGPRGRVLTLEHSAKHARVARENIDRAGLGGQVRVLEGRAADTLPSLRDEAPFDLVFIDADKENNPSYLKWALELTRPGAVLVVDNVVRSGAVRDAQNTRPDVVGTRTMIEEIGAAVRNGTLDATALQLVGSKGYDGILIAYVC